MPSDIRQKPEWLRLRALSLSNEFSNTLRVVKKNCVNTVCEEANCPNIGECWKSGTATFMILGDTCTRNCAFCNVKNGRPMPVDDGEPAKVAKSISDLGIRYAVITSVDRDDLVDSGSLHFANVITKIKENGILVEVLTPDFKRNMREGIMTVVNAHPDVFGHNIEIVRRLHRQIKKPPSNYDFSLDFLKSIKEISTDSISKTGAMVGVGEYKEEVFELIDDVANAGVDILTIGQYLPPSGKHYQLDRYVEPSEFEEYKKYGESVGIKVVESGPFVRSSYHAFESFRKIVDARRRCK
jgi:lipoic acid synthetase